MGFLKKLKQSFIPLRRGTQYPLTLIDSLNFEREERKRNFCLAEILDREMHSHARIGIDGTYQYWSTVVEGTEKYGAIKIGWSGLG